MQGIEQKCIHNYNASVGKHGRNEDRLEDTGLDGMHKNRMDHAEVGWEGVEWIDQVRNRNQWNICALLRTLMPLLDTDKSFRLWLTL